MAAGEAFFLAYGLPDGAKILDIGSRDVNGSLRSLAPKNASYVGLDIQAGHGVDVTYNIGESFPFGPEEFDACVSTSCFEHDAFFWETFLDIFRILKPGGLFYLNAPSNGDYHSFPFDNWRFYPDAGLALVSWGKKNGIDIQLRESGTLRMGQGGWADFIAVFQKAPATGGPARLFDKFPDASNVRHWTSDAIVNYAAFTEESLKIKQLAAELAAAQAAIEGAGHALASAQAKISNMERSRFWKLAVQWRKLSSVLRGR
ncbi:MAG TPA: methyltransferase domain-containing protein [Ancylobacter sp.]